jgi:tetratricopeptide (TPR) repeat protein
VDALRARIATLPEEVDVPEALAPPQVRTMILHPAALAAGSLGRWEQALTLNRESRASEERRGATALEMARTLYVDHSPLLGLGRVDEAREVLLHCRDVFEDYNDVEGLSVTMGALASVEVTLGHHDAAVNLTNDALRLAYAIGDVEGIAGAHSSLADALLRIGRGSDTSFAHWLASALLFLQMGSDRIKWPVDSLAHVLALSGDLRGSFAKRLPESFSDLCAQVDQIDGVRLEDIVSLFLPAGGEDAALAEVLRRTQAVPFEEAAESVWRKSCDEAEAAGQFHEALHHLRNLIRLLRDVGRWHEALALVDRAQTLTRRMNLGSWSRLANEGMRLQILRRQGREQEVIGLYATKRGARLRSLAVR